MPVTSPPTASGDIDEAVDCAFHGDDFLMVSTPEQLDVVDSAMEANFDINVLPRVGPGYQHEGHLLKRIITWSEEGYTWRADPNHALDLVKELGAIGGKVTHTPGSRDHLRRMRDVLEEVKGARAAVARHRGGKISYLGLDRPGITFASREVSKDMSSPKVRMEARTTRIIRHLNYAPELIWHYPYQKQPTYVETTVDSDWAGDVESRYSTTCVAEFHGAHLIEFSIWRQEHLALSSGEAEFYSHTSGAARVLHTRNLLAGMGCAVACHVAGDATAARRVYAKDRALGS